MTAATQLTTDHQSIQTGRVRLRDGDTYSVTIEGDREVRARRAASCLLTPEPGDHVLIAALTEPFILAVLERDTERRAELVVDGDAVIKATGELQITADKDVTLTTRQRLELFGRELTATTEHGKLFAANLSVVAKHATGSFEKLSVLAQTYEQIADNFVQRVERAYRFVAQYDQVRARHIDYRAEATTQLKGETTVVTARQVAKIDGESIHIG